MTEDVKTWIVVADGAHARVFEEKHPLAALQELSEEEMAQRGSDRPQTPQGGTVHERAGSGRHSGHDDSPKEEAEHRFLKRLADHLDHAAHAKAFDKLVLVAPPKALGLLRGELSAAVTKLVEVSDPHDRVKESAGDLHKHLKKLRAQA
jgi:protein required for attachment to host cells